MRERERLFNQWWNTATWLSPVTGKPVTPSHFNSFVDATRATYNRPRHIHTNKRF